MGQSSSGAARFQPGNGCRRQQNSTDYLGRAADRRTLSRRRLKPPTDCETTEKWIALIEPTRDEPDYYRTRRHAGCAAVGVREAAAIEELGGLPGRIETAEGHLGVRGIREAHCRDGTVAPGLLDQPGERIEAVLCLAQILCEPPLGAAAAATILIDDGIAVRGEVGGDL